MGRKSGFTLAEVLIALALLGIVAVFAIPKVLQANQNNTKIALLKESYGLVSQVVYEGTITQQLSLSNAIPYLSGRLNALRICDTNGKAQTCTKVDRINPDNGANASLVPAFVMPNGVIIFCNVTSSNGSLDTYIDWNGDGPPNAPGDDLLMLVGRTNGSDPFCSVSLGQEIVPVYATCPQIHGSWDNFYATNLATFQSITN